ncbi:scavenger receptor cysteine-rich type 1 protein M130-like, partial [Apteryx mantelli]|uniref:Scavenger receptor cysteine-rich type 1 protein M130-like n=1 Tax=Apteryx mantelli TaxID=2696672 RepID=A0ABM4G7W9_9AVES
MLVVSDSLSKYVLIGDRVQRLLEETELEPGCAYRHLVLGHPLGIPVPASAVPLELAVGQLVTAELSDPQDTANPQGAQEGFCGVQCPVVGVTPAQGAAEVRLEAGDSRCAGRVEVKHQGQWGTVCCDGWDMKDAAVVCKQLGCGSALQALRNAHFGPGSGPIWLSWLRCTGTETALSECSHHDWGKHDCIHAEDAGVVCSGFVQLVGGDSPCSGRVEIRDGDLRRTVCDSHFGLKAADVICRELQCGTVLSIPGAAHFGEGVGAIWDEELQCVGNESLLSSCP